MKTLKAIAFAVCTLLFCSSLDAQTYTWNGSASSNWNTPGNWTPVGPPAPASTVNITNSAAPNMPALPSNVTITNLTVNVSTLNLASFTLVVTGNASISGSTVTTGNISARDFTSIATSNFTGTTTLTKTGGGDNIWGGGNTFQNLTLVNNDNNYIRLNNTTADTYNGNTRFATTNGYIDVAYTANATFNGNLTIDASGANGVRFGQNNGSTTIASGSALLTNGYTSTQMIIRNVTQNGTAANGTFTPVNFTPTACIFGGNFTCTATTATITSSEFRATNSITATNLSGVRQSGFSSVSGTTTLTKSAGGANNWYGGNTFNNTTIINNSTNQTISLASTAADVFNGTTTFRTSGANRINVANTQGATFNGNVYVNNTGTSGIYFGANNGSTTIASGFALLTTGYATGVLSLRNIVQSGSTANGSFSAPTFTVLNCTFNGNFTVPTSTTISITGSTFNRTNSFTATNISTLATSSFSATSGTTTFTKTGGVDNTWTGGNTFANTTFTNSSTGRYIRSGTTVATTYNGTTRFVASGTGILQIAYSSNATFNGNVYVDCTTAGNISFGTISGTSTIAATFALLTNGFTAGTLYLGGITQNGTASNGSFSPTTFTAINSTFNGNFTLTTATTATITGSNFPRTNSFTAANISGVATSTFSTTSGTTAFVKTGGVSNIWNGGNTFSNCTFTNSSTNLQVRLAGTTGDTYTGTTRFIAQNANTIYPAYAGASTFAGNVTIDNSGTGGIYFGGGAGTGTIASSFALLTNGFSTGTLSLIGVIQNGSTTNSAFAPVTFVATNCNFGGNFTLTSATTATITGSTFSRTNSFTAADISGVATSTFSTTSGTTAFVKTGGAINVWNGGNTFSNCTFTNSSSNLQLRLAGTTGDTYTGTTRFIAQNANTIYPAFAGASTFAGNVTIDNSGTGGIYFGGGAGTSAIASTFALLTNGFSTGTLSLIGVTQNGSTTNSAFAPVTFVATNCNFGGNFTLTSATTATITGSTFNRTNSFSATNFGNITTSSFSPTSGTTAIIKTGGTTEIYTGGNTFNNTTFTNGTAGQLIRIGTTAATTFNGTTRFITTGTNSFQIAYSANATFNGNVYLDCTSTNGIFFGTLTGTTDIASGFAMLTNGFTAGTLALIGVTQDGSTANATFNPTTLTATNSTIRGNFTAVVSGTTTITTSVFQRTNSFTSGTFATMSGSNFSATSGTTTFTKTANTAELWTGGNTFYNTTITNNSASQSIRLASTTGDTYFGTTNFVTANAATILPAYNLASTAAGNVFLNVAGTGGISIGAGTGTFEIALGYALKTTGHSATAPLVIDGLTQLGTAANDSFRVSTMTITGSNIGGGLTFFANTAVLQTSTFAGDNRFFANAFTTVNNCIFSTGSSSTLITKRGVSNDTWAGPNTFGNVTMHNRSNGRLRLANGSPDTYVGTLIMVQDSTGAIEVAYNGANLFQGNISTVGSTSLVNMGSGTGTVVIDGNTAQSVLGSSSGITMSRLSMTTSGTFTLQTPLSILNALTFTNGKIVSDATNLLILADNATATGANTNSYVNGPVRKVGNDAFTFPTGDATYYAPIAIFAPGVVTDHFTAQYFFASPNDNGYDTTSVEATMETVSNREYWILDRTNGSSGVRVTMFWDTRSGSIADYTDLRVSRWNGSQWMDHSFSNYTGNNTAGSLTSANPITSFSPFTFGSTTSGAALPVEMTSFTAEVVTEGVQLNWTTAVEINNDHYVVERSLDGLVFEAIGRVAGMGNTSVTQYYEFLDIAPKPGLLYYRLKQVDIDGASETSEMVSVFIKANAVADVTWSTYPNPAINQIEIIGGEEGRMVGLELMDQNGSSLSYRPLVFGEKNTLDVSDLKPGMYIVRIVTPEKVTSQRFIKL